MAPRESRDSLSAAATASSSSPTTKPVSPSSTISGTEPLLNAITGVPQAIASINTKPKGSGQAMGASSAMAPLRKRDFSPSLISPTYSTSGHPKIHSADQVGSVRLGGFHGGRS